MCHDVTYATISAYLRDHPGGDQLELELELGASVGRHPSASPELYVGTFEDGSQILVEQHAPGKLTAAVRSAAWSVWGPPTFLDVAP